MSMVYLVGGATGEYSDHTAWYVRAFTSKPAADAFCEKLNAWCRERGYDKGNAGWYDIPYDKRDSEHPPGDARFTVDYTGTLYSVAEIPLKMADQFPVQPTNPSTQKAPTAGKDLLK